jgi:AraC-like DNA-binding protein
MGTNSLSGPWNHDSFQGDYEVETDSAHGVRLRRKSIGACTVIQATSSTIQSFRRTWEHIRADGIDALVFCFIKNGYLKLEYPNGEVVARSGDIVAAKSIAPFRLECGSGKDSCYEAVHLIVPTHIARDHLGQEVAPGYCTAAQARTFRICERILRDLVDDQGDIGDVSARRLVEAALASLADALRSNTSCAPLQNTADELQMRRVLRYIDLHLSNPNLSVSALAAECGMSSRYIFALFQRRGTTFSTVVWQKRIEAAAHWLSTSRSSDATIKEIAYRAGFKSSAHFARMFKRHFSESPRLFRAAAVHGRSARADVSTAARGVARH